MKTNIINVLFLFLFALAATSSKAAVTEVRKDESKPVPPGPSAVKVSTTDRYSYIIDGQTYSQSAVDNAGVSWHRAINDRPAGDLANAQKLVDDQKLVLEAWYLECWKDLSRPRIPYAKTARKLRGDMRIFVDVVLDPKAMKVNSDAILALARQTLEKYFQLEKEYGHDHFYPTKNGHRPLDDKEYLESLSKRLKEIENGPFE